MILSFDPGETTGFSLFTINAQFIKCGEVKFEEEIFNLLKTNPVQIVIIESFRLFPWHSKSLGWSTMRTVEVIGAIKAYCTILTIPIELQDPTIKKFFDIKKLQNLNLYTGFSAHERDAIRHALYYLHFKLKKELKIYVS